jgi:hypothetical protein
VTNPVEVVRSKLEHCQGDLTRWNRQKFGNIEEKLKKKVKEL